MTKVDDVVGHMDELPVTQGQCKASHKAIRDFTMWVAGGILVICLALASFIAGLGTANATIAAKVDAHEKTLVFQAANTAEARRELLARFDRIEAKFDTHIANVAHKP